MKISLLSESCLPVETKRLLPTTIAIGALLFWLPCAGRSADLQAGRRVSIPSGEIISGNLYVAAGEITLAGGVEGDLIAAGGDVFLQGTVAHDVAIGAGQIQLLGRVGGDVRIVGGQLDLSGQVNGDLVVAGGRVRVLPSASVGGDVLLAGGELVLEGDFKRGLEAVAGNITINSTVAGPVRVRTATLVIGERANLESELSYFAPQEATIHKNAKIAGPVTFHLISGMDQDWLRRMWRRVGLVFFFLRFLMTLGAGLLVYFLLRKPTQELVRYALNNFGKELLRGFVLFFVMPPAIFLMAVTVVGVPFAFLGGLLHLGLGIVAIIYSGIALGTLLLKFLWRQEEYTVSWQAVMLGIPLAFLVRIVPILGFLLNAIFFLVVFGALYQRFWTVARSTV